MELHQLKQQLSLADVLRYYGLQPNKNNMLRCPFHADKTPSMQVYFDTNTAFCFSSNCALHGKAIDQLDFLMYHEQCSKHEAFMKAKTLVGAAAHAVAPTATPKENAIDFTAAFHTQRQGLPRSKKAVAYLQSRHLDYLSLEVGYNHSNTAFKYLQNCVTFPLKNATGKVVSLYGRSLKSGHYYTPHRKGLYPSYPNNKVQRLILSESVIDAATILQHTGEAVLALYGTNGWTNEHTQALSKLPALQELVLFFDGDQAGQAAVAKYHAQFAKQFPQVVVSQVQTPEEEDPNSLLNGHETSILNHLIGNRKPLSEPIAPPLSFSNEPFKTAPPTGKKAPTLNTENSDFLVFESGNLRISVLGGIGTYPVDKLKVTLKLERTESHSPLHRLRHSLDLYHDDQTEKFTRKAAERLELGSREVALPLAELTEALEAYRAELIEQQKPKKEKERFLTQAEEKAAIAFLGLFCTHGSNVA